MSFCAASTTCTYLLFLDWRKRNNCYYYFSMSFFKLDYLLSLKPQLVLVLIFCFSFFFSFLWELDVAYLWRSDFRLIYFCLEQWVIYIINWREKSKCVLVLLCFPRCWFVNFHANLLSSSSSNDVQVEKIFGPGNQYVTAAKMILQVGILIIRS